MNEMERAWKDSPWTTPSGVGQVLLDRDMVLELHTRRNSLPHAAPHVLAVPWEAPLPAPLCKMLAHRRDALHATYGESSWLGCFQMRAFGGNEFTLVSR